MLIRSRRLVAVTLLAAAATGMSGCCGKGGMGGWGAFLLGRDCGRLRVTSIEIVPPERPVVAGESTRLTVRSSRTASSRTRTTGISMATATQTATWDPGPALVSTRRWNTCSLAPAVSASASSSSPPTVLPRAVATSRRSRSMCNRRRRRRTRRRRGAAIAGRSPRSRRPRASRSARASRWTHRPSRDPDGEIVDYRWDLEGDTEAELRSTRPVAEHAYATAGERTITLTVQD